MRERLDRLIFSVIKVIPTWILPNYLSVFRALMFVPIVILLWYGRSIAAAVLLIFAISLDVFDGVLARKRNQVTKTGEWLDPSMDKVLILGVLWGYGWYHLPHWLVISITILEILLTLSRPLKNKFGITMRANFWGKIKMSCQSVAIISLTTGINLIKPLTVFFFLLGLLFALLDFLTHLGDIFVFRFKKDKN